MTVRFKEIRLHEAVEVVHKHGVGSCEGRLLATPQGVRYETTNKNDAFSLSFEQIETFEVDYLKKNLRVKRRGGKTWNFTTRAENADPLFVFHREVQKVLGSGLKTGSSDDYFSHLGTLPGVHGAPIASSRSFSAFEIHLDERTELLEHGREQLRRGRVRLAVRLGRRRRRRPVAVDDPLHPLHDRGRRRLVVRRTTESPFSATWMSRTRFSSARTSSISFGSAFGVSSTAFSISVSCRRRSPASCDAPSTARCSRAVLCWNSSRPARSWFDSVAVPSGSAWNRCGSPTVSSLPCARRASVTVYVPGAASGPAGGDENGSSAGNVSRLAGFAAACRRSQATRWKPAVAGPVSRRTTLPTSSVTVSTIAGASSRSSARSASHVG